MKKFIIISTLTCFTLSLFSCKKEEPIVNYSETGITANSGSPGDNASSFQRILTGNTSLIIQSVQRTSDGGYVLAGASNNAINRISTAILVKVNAFGETVWAKQFPELNYNSKLSLLKDEFSDAFVLSSTYVNQANEFSGNKGKVIKVGNDGNTLWETSVALDSLRNFGVLFSTPDQGYICTGRVFKNAEYHTMVVKINASGQEDWRRFITNALVNDGAQRGSQGFYLCGSKAGGTNGADLYLALFDNEGVLLESNVVPLSNSEIILTMALDQNADIYTLGVKVGTVGSGHFIRKYAAGGSFLWELDTDLDVGFRHNVSLSIDVEGNILVCGNTSNPAGGFLNPFLTKYSPSGDVIFTRTYTNSSQSLFEDLVATPDGGCIAVGYAQNDAGTRGLVVKVDANGE